MTQLKPDQVKIKVAATSLKMDEEAKRWAAKRKSALIIALIHDSLWSM